MGRSDTRQPPPGAPGGPRRTSHADGAALLCALAGLAGMVIGLAVGLALPPDCPPCSQASMPRAGATLAHAAPRPVRAATGRLWPLEAPCAGVAPYRGRL